MKISCFTFIRNGTLLGYPYIESIRSALPLCDEFVIAVGDSVDDTVERIRAIGDDKIRIIETSWNEKMIDRGYVYGQQKMIAHFNCSGDWAFYLEGDEVLHEDELPRIKATMEKHLEDQEVEALIFDFHHFYGEAGTIALGPHFYRQAPRIIRNSIRSYAPDGLFFVVMDKNKRGRYPTAALANANIYHYGHVRSVEKMQEKIQRVSKYWGSAPPEFKSYGDVDSQGFVAFDGSHPKIMQDWLKNDAQQSFSFNENHALTKKERGYRTRRKLEKWLGIDTSKKHFRLVKK